MEKLILLLGYTAPFSDRLQKRIRRIIKRHEFKKGQIILPEGETCNYIYYIETGLVRSYISLEQKEVSNWFMKEGDIFISVQSFFRRTPSVDIHVALEDCVCWGISYEELEETYSLFPKFERHGRLIAIEYYCRLADRVLDLVRQTPQHKYEMLMEKDPDLLLRITNKHMASYLDVGMRTYNKIKKEYAEKKKKKGRR